MTSVMNVGLVAPACFGLALVHAFPSWWHFVFEIGGVEDEPSLPLLEAPTSIEALAFHVLSVPILALSLLASLALLHWHASTLLGSDKQAAEMCAMTLNTTQTRLTPGVDAWINSGAKVYPHGLGADSSRAKQREQQQQEVSDFDGAAYANLTVDELLREGTSAERALDVRKALSLYQRALELDESHIEARIQANKARCDLGFLIFDTANNGPMKQFFTCRETDTIKYATDLVGRALTGARQFTEDHPEDATGFTLLALCIGRSILVEKQSKRKVKLAGEMYAAAQRAIALDPKDDAAHFMLARWHNDIASLPRVMKTLIKFVFGSSLKGDFARAVACARAAISLDPKKIVNRVELGRALTGLGDLAGAKDVYASVLDLEVEDVNSALYRQIAVDDIRRIEEGKPVGSLARPWWAVGG